MRGGAVRYYISVCISHCCESNSTTFLLRKNLHCSSSSGIRCSNLNDLDIWLHNSAWLIYCFDPCIAFTKMYNFDFSDLDLWYMTSPLKQHLYHPIHSRKIKNDKWFQLYKLSQFELDWLWPLTCYLHHSIGLMLLPWSTVLPQVWVKLSSGLCRALSDGQTPSIFYIPC